MSVITPYVCVADAVAAIDWYTAAMGATVAVDPIVMDDGRVGHAELSFGGARVMLSEEFAEVDVAPPAPARGSAVTLHLAVDDVDDAAGRVTAAGVTLDRGPEDTGVGRVAVFRDPFGHRWFLNQEHAGTP